MPGPDWCQTVYEALRSRGAVFLTPPYDWGSEIRCFLQDRLSRSTYTRWVRVPKLTVSPAQEKFCQTARRWLLDSATMLSLPS